jgi:fatty acid desaturase
MYRIEPLTDDAPRRPRRPQRRDCEAPRTSRWPLERVLFALAGTMTLLSALLAAVVSPWFLLLTAFVGVNQWLYVLFGACPASIVLQRVLRLEVTK